MTLRSALAEGGRLADYQFSMQNYTWALQPRPITPHILRNRIRAAICGLGRPASSFGHFRPRFSTQNFRIDFSWKYLAAAWPRSQTKINSEIKSSDKKCFQKEI